MVKNRQKGITKGYRNDKKDVDTSLGNGLGTVFGSLALNLGMCSSG